jgi:hypothetical protein
VDRPDVENDIDPLEVPLHDMVYVIWSDVVSVAFQTWPAGPYIVAVAESAFDTVRVMEPPLESVAV